MVKIKQIGTGRKSSGTIDGVNYYVRGGVTYARSTPNMPARAFNNPKAKKRQAIFKFVQMHIKFHLGTIKQTISPQGNITSTNRYHNLNAAGFTAALGDLAEKYCAGQEVTITDVENAISSYAAEHPTSIKIASKTGYNEVYLTGAWPNVITLNTSGGDKTMIIIVAENGDKTVINPDGSTSVDVPTSNEPGSSGSNGNGESQSGNNSGVEPEPGDDNGDAPNI